MNIPQPTAGQPHLDDYRLEDRYTRDQGRVFLTGTQALVRIALRQAELDRKKGLKTGGMISGYRGSPLGAVDLELWKARKLLDNHQIEFIPAINEDLAATLLLGTQQVETDPERQVDGVFGLWYGKGPGVDRSGDALKHGNAYGSSPHGGVLVVAGDDHGCVSSSMPHQSDVAFMSWFMPVIHPASVAEYESFGLWGYALSRYSGCWVGFKAVSETVESAASVEVPPLPEFVIPDDFTPPADGLHYRWPDLPGPQLETRMEHKLAAVQAFARANPLDRRILNLPHARFGLVTTGKAHLDLMEALQLLGLDETRLRELGIDIYKVAMVWPLNRQGALDFVHGKQEILVVEEKRGIIESQIKEYMSEPDHPGEVLVTGKQDEQGQPLIPYVGVLSPLLLAEFVALRLERFFGLKFSDQLEALKANCLKAQDPGGARRLPYFCSGCPHNTSTKVPEGSKALAGIGCHFMASWMGRQTESLIQMGGEGVNWVGRSRFTGKGHIFQNLGEGTWFHSGSMAVRQAVAAGVNITYKILFNDAVAMTGGQPVDGPVSVPMIARQSLDEGVKKVVVVTDEPEKYRREHLPAGISVHHRDELDSLQRKLRDIPGCTVLIYDQACAAEKRRRRKRGLYPDPARRVMINPHVCEACGDCSVQSNCLSVVPRETPLGRKRQIDQSSCNKDFSCVQGFCPSFVTIEGGQLRKGEGLTVDAAFQQRIAALPQPQPPSLEQTYNLLVCGVGGTGVITVGQLITMAAHLEGKGSSVLDFMGFAQKGGSVISFIRLAPSPQHLHQVRIENGQTHALLACDLLVATSARTLPLLQPGKTRMVCNEAELPSADYVLQRDASMGVAQRLALLRSTAPASGFASLQANRLAERLMGDSVYANVLLLGYAWQQGLLPVSESALLRAIELNAVAVDLNKQAFAWGRLAAAEPEQVEQLQDHQPLPETASLQERIQHHAGYLTHWQHQAWADQYQQQLERVRQAEMQLLQITDTTENPSLPLTEAVARQLFRLMSYKDEYEVARLFTRSDFLDEVNQTFTGHWQLHFHMAPPLLNFGKDAAGRPKKRRYGRWLLPVLRLLANLKGLRNTALDPFRFSQDRKLDRQLLTDYQQLLDDLLQGLKPDNHTTAVALARLPEEIRGFGPVREAAAHQVQARKEKLLREFREGKTTTLAIAV
ncbi:indolepyruvate ferredoxin oxidoreductase family protein [Marinospirillum alkaliphilum]|uniref:Indolepyruvate ferredoxin oxidoreductase n=1 Tax=Marinospirillum alkaliphilum DSM 21637 TaxID=1122209 RepID=A0A1K1TYI1_9GAMM|nr:indolepyruvate ferredoxin oxidoreductase family protein [Marinospirillum alkaliphilum]SFX05576.1 indolepyruvate ferredoxin oxidoreductase [Marinospirillum alkaliphilum DSM 21637]